MPAPPPPYNPAGRPKGVPNKITTQVKELILAALDEAGGEGGGKAYLVAQAKKNPVAFMALLAKILPTQVEANVSIFERLTIDDRRTLDDALALAIERAAADPGREPPAHH